MPGRLHGIVAESEPAACATCAFGNGLQNACFIVRRHNAHEAYIAIENGLIARALTTPVSSGLTSVITKPWASQ